MGKSKKQATKSSKEVPGIEIILDPMTADEENDIGRVRFMARDNKKEAPEEEDEEMNEIEFQNEIVRVIKELKAEKENVKLLEVELKIAKEHAKSLNKKNEESKEIIISFKV